MRFVAVPLPPAISSCVPLRSQLQLAMKACPYRATFYPKLGSPQDVVQVKMEEWLTALEHIVDHMEKVFKAGPYGEI